MPTVEISRKDLEKLVGRKASSMEGLEEWLMWVKGEIDDVDGDTIKVDVKDTNRPDLWSVEGMAREIRGHLKIEGGLPHYTVGEALTEVFVDKKLKDIRPVIGCAIVKNVKFDDESIRQLMQLQEKIHHTFGRKREYVAIGVSNFDKIKPPIFYKAVKPDELKFPPLGFEEEMTPAEILEKHPKGQEYGHLVEMFKRYPIIVDSKKEVISMPPIINSNTIGRIDENTRNVFIDVTGLREEDVFTALNVMVTVLADRGGEIYGVVVHDVNGKKLVLPDLTPKSVEVESEKIRRILGIEISDHEIVELLKDARYDAEVVKDGVIVAKYLPTRNDILHWRDVAEDVAISFGYNDILPAELAVSTHGELSRRELLSDKIRELMLGYELQEVMTFTLTNKEVLFTKMNRKEEDVVEIANPVSSSWTTIRNTILPCLMEFLARNKHVEYPQRIFEVGDVVEIDEKAETATRTKRHLAIAIASSTASFTEIKEIVESFAKQLGLKFEYEEEKDGAFIEGRCARIMLGNKKIGVMGEINPAVLNNWELEMPVAAAEIELEEIMKHL